jgi:hypothetical protein
MIAPARTVAKGKADAAAKKAQTVAKDRAVATPMAVAKATQVNLQLFHKSDSRARPMASPVLFCRWNFLSRFHCEFFIK